jgi:hypothetical protein
MTICGYLLDAGIAEKNIDLFLWEVFTTKPYFDNGELKYVCYIIISYI